MPTVDGITFTDKRETFKFYGERWDEAYYKHLERLKGGPNPSELAKMAAHNEISAPSCEKHLTGICAGFTSYIVTKKPQLRCRYWWMYISQISPDTVEHDGRIYIRTPICIKCSTFIDSREAGKHGRSIDDLHKQLTTAMMTDEEKVECRPIIGRGYAAGKAILDKSKEEHGADRYKPKGRRR